MKTSFIIFTFLYSTISVAQNDMVIYERAKTLQYAHYETDLLEMTLSKDTVKVTTANKIINQLQKQAIYEYDQLIEKFPQSNLIIDALYQKAEAEYSIGMNLDAKETFIKVISHNPKKGKSLIRLAYIALEEKKYSDALKYIEQRKKSKPLFFCGNEFQTEESQIKFIEEQCKIGLLEK